MQVINSRPFTIKKDIETVFDLAGEPESARHFLSKVGDKPMFKDVSVTDDSIAAKLPFVGDITFRRNRIEKPSLVSYKAEGSPVPVELVLNFQPDGENTKTQVSVEVEAPSFVAGMVKTKLQPMLDKMADSLELLDVDRFLGKK
ncbi:hypothetical protein [uncultured Porphyromonas sp.]|uniref:hypothetical protein n=1 Tax=uncultured Porphyromonas sp. TaxID=159274 RepID=UPI00260B18C8|nr:hypothetical protein [uncultured Porphyromonas sp.]